MLQFKIYRNDSNDFASDCDLGDLEFVFGDQTVSSHGDSRLSNMIYVSIFDLIDGLLRLKNGTNRYEFVGTDSSFIVRFERNREGVYALRGKKRYGPISLSEPLQSINCGIDNFLGDPRNTLPADGAVYGDFNASRQALKRALK